MGSESGACWGDSVSDIEGVLEHIVLSDPGLSGQDIFDSLLDEERASFASAMSVERVLARMTGAAHKRGGRWFPGPVGTSGVQEEEALPKTDPARILDDELRGRLTGRRLVAEV